MDFIRNTMGYPTELLVGIEAGCRIHPKDTVIAVKRKPGQYDTARVQCGRCSLHRWRWRGMQYISGDGQHRESRLRR
jgi:hypothetical protein